VLEMTPAQIVERLDKHIVGQAEAKRAAAIALRNRWRWQQLPDELKNEVTPKNILMIGPTGVGKTEICRRLATMTGAPFVKVEATKYTEVGYYGRDVESMIRDLVEAGITIVRNSKRTEVEAAAKERVVDRLLDLLLPVPEWSPDEEEQSAAQQRHDRTLAKLRDKLISGELEEREVELTIEQRKAPVQVFSNMGMEQMDMDLQGMFENLIPKRSSERLVKVSEARDILLEEEFDGMMDANAINEEAIHLAETTGMIFLDEIDKVCGQDGGGRGGDVSRQGVQRDLLPIVEGTTVTSRYGTISTEHIMFIAAGAFHNSKPSDLMPELQGRFPIRVELQDLTRDDFVRILTEPSGSLTKQYAALLGVDNVAVTFTEDGIAAIADAAFKVNQTTQNIGARRLQTIMERLLEPVSYEAPYARKKKVNVDAKYVAKQLDEITQDEDLSRFIL
jgi:ATP-dependent HslUV protease ATP-binding subunit HslU